MTSEQTEQPVTDEAHIDRDRAQDAAVGAGGIRVLPARQQHCLSPALSVTLHAALDRLLRFLGSMVGLYVCWKRRPVSWCWSHRAFRHRWPRATAASK